MTEQQPHTPTTDSVRRAFMDYEAWGQQQMRLRGEVFDRWLAAVEAAAEQRGAIKALRDAVKEDRMYNGISFFVPEEALLDRADQKENQ